MKASCQHCNGPQRRATGREIYPHRRDLWRKRFWLCQCGAYVGCHPDGSPFGPCCNAIYRAAKIAAHAAFDAIWKSGRVTRGDAYGWLAKQLGVAREACHIGYFTPKQCGEVIRVCREHGHEIVDSAPKVKREGSQERAAALADE